MINLIRYHRGFEHLKPVRKSAILGSMNSEVIQLTGTHIRREDFTIDMRNNYARWKYSLRISRRERSFEVTYYCCVCSDRFALSII